MSTPLLPTFWGFHPRGKFVPLDRNWWQLKISNFLPAVPRASTEKAQLSCWDHEGLAVSSCDRAYVSLSEHLVWCFACHIYRSIVDVKSKPTQCHAVWKTQVEPTNQCWVPNPLVAEVRHQRAWLHHQCLRLWQGTTWETSFAVQKSSKSDLVAVFFAFLSWPER